MSAADAEIPLWPDNPRPQDLVGFGDIAAPILDAVARERLDPVAIGVFGDCEARSDVSSRSVDYPVLDAACIELGHETVEQHSVRP